MLQIAAHEAQITPVRTYDAGVKILNLDHERCQLAHAIDWDRFDTMLADGYSDENGKATLSGTTN